MRGCTSAQLRATRQSRLIAFYGVGPDGAIVRREVMPQVPPEDMGVRCPTYPQVTASRPTLMTSRKSALAVDGTIGDIGRGRQERKDFLSRLITVTKGDE